jgi:hypothetical protein
MLACIRNNTSKWFSLLYRGVRVASSSSDTKAVAVSNRELCADLSELENTENTELSDAP